MATRKAFVISAFEDRLSRFFSNHPGLCRFLGNLETKIFLDEIAVQTIDRPIYITGLARSGSTILLERLAAHEQTASHCYRDYPLTAVPLWWNWFLDRAAGSRAEPVERFHRDGIFITPRSPEAMEEILWMIFFPGCHRPSRSHVIDAHRRYPAFEKFYRDHVRKILFLRRGRRYLSKANYHVTRMAYLKKIFPDARFVISVRNPAGQIASLLRQHRLFCEQERRDGRILNYMRIAGHFEFGLDRRPVNTGCPKTVDRIRSLWKEGREVEGSALLWKSVYRHIVERLSSSDDLRASSIIVNHDDLRRFPEDMLAKIYAHCGLAVDGRFLRDQARRIIPFRDDDPSCFTPEESAAIDAETRDVYEKILGFAR